MSHLVFGADLPFVYTLFEFVNLHCKTELFI